MKIHKLNMMRQYLPTPKRVKIRKFDCKNKSKKSRITRMQIGIKKYVLPVTKTNLYFKRSDVGSKKKGIEKE